MHNYMEYEVSTQQNSYSISDWTSDGIVAVVNCQQHAVTELPMAL